VSERTGKSASFIAGAVIAAVVVGGGGVAWAATGKPLLIGQSNKGTKTTKIVNTKGTPLGLTARAGRAPLTVNSKGKVANLNADLVDGVSSESFARTKGQFGVIAANGVFQDVDGDGAQDSLWAVAACPAGTQLTGGGTNNYTGNTTIISSSYKGAWVSASIADPTADTPDNVVAYAICYNPTGAVAGGLSFFSTKQIPAALKEMAARAIH
jgi:hypothetical protein